MHKVWAASISALLLCSCSSLNRVNPLADEKFNPVGAAPLKTVDFDPPVSSQKAKAEIADLVTDSIHKCDQFRKDMVITVDSVDTLSDVMTTTLSALATAFSPLATTHALSAAATIVSGNKTAIDSDIYAKASIANLVSALNKTYYTNISDFNNSIATLDVSNPTVAVNKLALIHSQCSLDAIEASIGATIGSAPEQTATPSPPAGSSAPTPIPGDAIAH